MKKTVLLGLCVLYSAVAHADYLDDKIATLTQQKLDIIAELEKCQKASGNLKIAGITTLGVSAIGIGANIAEAVALNKTEDKIDAANTKLETLDAQIADAQAKKAAEEVAKQSAVSKTPADQDEIESCPEEKPCDGSADLGALNAKSADCLGGDYVATACADGVTYTEKKCKKADGNVFVYYQCEKVADEPVAQNDAPKKHHDDCSADETAKLAGAASSWWSGSMRKCVIKSCQDGWFLTMKGNISQGVCRKTCPEYQIVDGPNGGKACDITKEEAVQQNLEQVKSFVSTDKVKETVVYYMVYTGKCTAKYENKEYVVSGMRGMADYQKNNRCRTELKKQLEQDGYDNIRFLRRY